MKLQGLLSLSSMAGIAATALLLVSPVHAAVFQDGVRWPTDSSGYATIPVCIAAGSSSEPGSGWSTFFNYPSLEEAITHVQYALSYSWEANSSVRFVGWSNCDDLSETDRAATVGLYIHRDAPNQAYLGTGSRGMIPFGIQFKPWGNGEQCVYYDGWTVTAVYRWACIEQYAIHEFGHVLGFDHEWRHPATPQSCLDIKPGEVVLGSTEYATTLLDPASYTVVRPDYYDWDSIMTYDDQCATVSGERFGSENLSDIDKAAVADAYPLPGRAGGGQPQQLHGKSKTKAQFGGTESDIRKSKGSVRGSSTTDHRVEADSLPKVQIESAKKTFNKLTASATTDVHPGKVRSGN